MTVVLVTQVVGKFQSSQYYERSSSSSNVGLRRSLAAAVLRLRRRVACGVGAVRCGVGEKKMSTSASSSIGQPWTRSTGLHCCTAFQCCILFALSALHSLLCCSHGRSFYYVVDSLACSPCRASCRAVREHCARTLHGYKYVVERLRTSNNEHLVSPPSANSRSGRAHRRERRHLRRSATGGTCPRSTSRNQELDRRADSHFDRFTGDRCNTWRWTAVGNGCPRRGGSPLLRPWRMPGAVLGCRGRGAGSDAAASDQEGPK